MPVIINGAGSINGLGTFTTLNVGGLPSGVILADTLATSAFATAADLSGLTVPSGAITSGTSQLALSGTVNQTSIASGSFVAGQGIPAGTTVISGAGTYVVGLSSNANVTYSGTPVVFYKPNAIVSPGALGGQLCEAWVNFNGAVSPIVIRSSYNVSSITDNAGQGDYTVNFTTALPDANYAVSVTQGTTAGMTSTTSYTINSVTVNTYNSAGTLNDRSIVNVSVFR